MKILIVSYYYAPDHNPRAFRWTAIAEYLSSHGHEISVIAGWKPGQAREETINSISIQRVGGSLIERLRKVLASGTASSPSGGSLSQDWRQRISRALYAATWRRIYWPDHAMLWVGPARRTARRIFARTEIDALITVSHPFSSHWVGLALRRAFPATRWLCDIGDPFAFFREIPANNHALYAARNFRAESGVLAAADAISVTVESCRQEYARHFPDIDSKVTVIPPLLSSAMPDQSSPRRDRRARLVYSGTLYPQLREPDYLFQVFSSLLDQGFDGDLHLFGQLNGCERVIDTMPARCRQRIVVHGVVPRARLMQELKNASVLINIGNRTAHQLPSKLVEYLATGRPILNLYSCENDSSLAALSRYPVALSIPITDRPPDTATSRRIMAFVAMPRDVDSSTVAAVTAPYRIDAVGGAYLSLLMASPRSGKCA